MFGSLSSNLSGLFKKLRGKLVISESDYDEVARSIRLALLEADVALSVAKSFVADVREKIVGASVVKGTSSADTIIKLIHDQLVTVLGSTNSELNLSRKGSILLMVGLQGAGKTTATAKIAKMLSRKKGSNVLVASLDTYRPAAQHQLEVLCKSAEISCLPIVDGQLPLEILKRALSEMKDKNFDCLILDTAGRLHIDDTMMDELVSICNVCKPDEKLIVVDSMTGQDSVNIANMFNKQIELTGVMLSRVDGDSRGGAALSMKVITGCPIKLMSVGEKIDDIEVFYPDRVANRILNMGDVVSLVERASDIIGKENIEKMQAKAFSGKFTLNDFVEQISMLDKVGGFSMIKRFLPEAPGMNEDAIKNNVLVLKKYRAVVNSMTKSERLNPDAINFSRKKRIAAGSGTQVNDVSELLKKFRDISKIYKMFSGKEAPVNPTDLMKMLRKGKKR